MGGSLSKRREPTQTVRTCKLDAERPLGDVEPGTLPLQGNRANRHTTAPPFYLLSLKTRERAARQYVMCKTTIYTVFRSINEGLNRMEWLPVIQLIILEKEILLAGGQCYEGWKLLNVEMNRGNKRTERRVQR